MTGRRSIRQRKWTRREYWTLQRHPLQQQAVRGIVHRTVLRTAAHRIGPRIVVRRIARRIVHRIAHLAESRLLARPPEPPAVSPQQAAQMHLETRP